MAIIDVIKFNGILNRDWLVYRYPGESFVFGTQLIVGEGQIAVFVKGGRALDYFSAGTYTLNTQNIPLLQSLINIPFGGRTPFTAEVFFINKTAKLDILWGTTDPISLIDPKYAVRLRVRAFGQFAIRISDYRVFLTELIGALGDSQVIKYDLVIKYFKGVLVTKIKTIIADIIINQKISALEITPHLEELSEIAKQRLSSEFDRFGIEIINLFITSINFPDEDFDMINKILGEKAAFDIIGDSRYNVKRSFDVMETAAGNEGSGNLVSAGIGVGLGAGAGIAVGNNFMATAENNINTSGKSVACRKCNTLNREGDKFCSNCGEKLSTEKIECYSCKTLIDGNMKFCPNCGCSMMKRICSNCSKENLPGTKFCSECGTKLEG
ncbi:SPFH domain-containing protein [Clostridium manihotivorum]|uniref:Virion core protein (Lumpy skin disease virus) n=1 Tax=Clostridium manihotivorum TaxID=2320868 RepID=A0A410DQN9_9CLOT|nr:SPFH domain-containing protein [Clostridium manihotivorum]QAA31351.1 virion core protein (lumpy skin disease virus) [Clostridium manihotivorum]